MTDRRRPDLPFIPVDDDFRANAVFPGYVASDTVFRAAENRVGIVAGATSGVSQIISPYGIQSASGAIKERGFITGETIVHKGRRKLYNR